MKRFIPTFVVLGLGAVFVAGVPLPHHITCPFTIQPRGGQAVYVRHEAVLKAVHVRAGQRVAAGTLLAEMDDLESRLRLARLRAEGEELAAELELLQRGREPSPSTTARIQDLQQALATNTQGLREYEEIIASFRITAPRDGIVIPEWTAHHPDTGEHLGSWDGWPLDDENLGTRLPSGVRVCTVGDLRQIDAVLAVNEHDIQLVQQGQSVTLMLDCMPGRRLQGTVKSIARKEAEKIPASLVNAYGGTIQLQLTTRVEAGERKPSDQHFEACVPLPASDVPLSSGLRGQARIRAGSRTLLERVMLYLYRNLHKKL